MKSIINITSVALELLCYGCGERTHCGCLRHHKGHAKLHNSVATNHHWSSVAAAVKNSPPKCMEMAFNLDEDFA